MPRRRQYGWTNRTERPAAAADDVAEPPLPPSSAEQPARGYHRHTRDCEIIMLRCLERDDLTKWLPCSSVIAIEASRHSSAEQSAGTSSGAQDYVALLIKRYDSGDDHRPGDRLAMDISKNNGRKGRKNTIGSNASSGVAVPPLKETVGNGYATLLELVTNEDIYLINFYGIIYKLDG